MFINRRMDKDVVYIHMYVCVCVCVYTYIYTHTHTHTPFKMYKLDLEKAEEPEIKLPTFTGSERKQGIPEKHLLLLY